MRNFLITILCSIFCLSCDAQERKNIELKGTKWECKIAENCINIYEFTTDTTFTFMSCEMEDKYFGDYYFKDGFLILDQKGSVYDKGFSSSSRHKTERKLYKLKIKEDELKHLSLSDWINGKWVKSNFKFDGSYVYKRIN